jgi:hypothetical protein
MSSRLKKLKNKARFCTTAMIICAILLIVAGCKKAGQTSQKSVKFEIDKSYSRGPLTAHIRIDKSKITIADTIRLEFETAIGPDYGVNMPKIDVNVLENFGIVDWQNPANRLDVNNNVVSTVQYRLEPFLSGKFAIPAFTFEFHDVNEQGGKTYQLTTEPVDIEVTSLLGEQRSKLTMADIEGVVGMPGRLILWWLLPAAAVVAGTGGLWWYLRKQKIKAASRIYKPAHEVAYARLQALINRDLLKQGKVKEFYEGVSDILRHYIEDRFELRAPERTTEEFLAEIRDTGVLTEAHRKVLAEFLMHCDLVKFAKHSPTVEQIKRTFDLAKDFIAQTKSDERQIDVTDMVGSSVAVPAPERDALRRTAKQLAGGA